MLQKMIEQALQNAMTRAMTKAMNKAIDKKIKNLSEKESQEWRGSFHHLVTGYALAYTMKWLGIPLIIFLLACSLGCFIAYDTGTYLILIAYALLFLFLICYTRRKMMMIIYWDGGIRFMDRKANTLVTIPSGMLQYATIQKARITFEIDGKKYKIQRNPQDNEAKVKEMLMFYGIDPNRNDKKKK